MHSFFFIFVAYVFLVRTTLADLEIVPGATWTVPDTAEHLQAHGAGIIEDDGYFYIVGENKTSTPINPGGNRFNSVACYRSTDLVQWEFVNDILTATDSDIYPESDLNTSKVIERPKIIYNNATKQYVLWMHVDSSDYSYARAGVAYCDSVCGDYSYLGSISPLGNVSRDMNLFVDTDETGYLLSEDRNHGTTIYKLSEDYLNVTELTWVWNSSEYTNHEAPAMIKTDGVYYMFGSRLTGWSANDNEFSTATNISGPWTDWEAFTPSGSNTYNSQTTYIQQVGDSFIYMGDRWVSTALWSSTYIWLPLTLNPQTRTANLTYEPKWSISPTTGTISTPPPPPPLTNPEPLTEAENPSNTFSSSLSTLHNTNASNETTIGPLGFSSSSNSSITLKNIYITNMPGNNAVTFKFNYTNTSGNTTYLDINVANGVTMTTLAFLETGDEGVIGTSVLHLNVDQVAAVGSNNFSVGIVGSEKGVGRGQEGYVLFLDCLETE